jgi:uncharacterized protein YndB with AHSA1/START domain
MSDLPDADATATVEHDCTLEAAPETVWRALTTPEILADWLGATDLSPEPGARFTVEAGPEAGGRVACEILEAVPHERLSYAWRVPGVSGRDVDSTVTFELAPAGEGRTHLRVVHRGLPAARRAPTRMGPARALAQLRPPAPHARRSTPLLALRRAA